jgi:hypothetical protein
LCKRGSLTLFIDPKVLQEWDSLIRRKKEAGGQTCSDSIIRCCLLIKLNYGLRYRHSTGFLKSIFELTGKSALPVPDYTPLCRRQKELPAAIEERLSRGENLVTGTDSTGLKVCGEGEWEVRRHGWSRHRTWRKLHICTDLITREILSAELTGNNEDDAPAGIWMLKGESAGIKGFKGDGAYDKFGFGEVVIPPPQNAAVCLSKRKKPLPEHLIQRNEAVKYIQEHGSGKWKEKQGYHRRSLNEIVMFRYKTVFGGGVNGPYRRKSDNRSKVEMPVIK